MTIIRLYFIFTGIVFEELLPIFVEQGMSEKEALIYLTVLQLGSAAASTVARKANLKRVTVYSILKDLERRQIAFCVEKHGTSYFQVIDPTRLLEQLKKKIAVFEDKIPQLLALTDVYNNKPRMEYFEGLPGLKTMYEDLLTSQTDICAFLGNEALDEDLKNYLNTEFLPRRLAKKIFAKVLVSLDESNKTYKELDEAYYKQTKTIKHPLFSLGTEINLYGAGKVALALFSSYEMSAIVIHSQKLYDSLISIFTVLRDIDGGS